MEINILPSLKKTIPDFKIGVIEYFNIVVTDSPQMVKGRLQLFQENIYFDLEEKGFYDYEGLREWKTIFKKVGTDPNRYRPSVESLYRRIKKQNYIGTINSAADINNFFSLQYEVPIGIYDIDKLTGDKVEIKVGTSSDEYEAINGRNVSMNQKILSCDSQGAFGSPIVDSARSGVTTSTKNALQLIYLKPSMTSSEGLELIQSLKNMFIQIHGGTAEATVIG
ncbi:B3/B4 domain-containing protein [Litchfieldia salsa]|uniref:B3/B4 domain-containing protein (DNA/RNA-binding domain of Phe-tRNA-synthetase) n=1 Tax=Litchfieldia salsa TaxID=930152 RepID=A0A1H0VQP6_9BACI|nr:phenylalanine--tRNA ligase beta subunit-related protein [Litchfieldia salsa]SDP80929.1 B3/B4 domain-containing protein (DNA/RNA-binding domain of Phe-tRNA-synthetase) [Litchfieldia salsa]